MPNISWRNVIERRKSDEKSGKNGENIDNFKKRVL